MKAINLIFIFLFAVASFAPAMAQSDETADKVAVLEAALARLNPELAALERAIGDPNTIIWMTDSGWSSASMDELVSKVAFVQMAAARPEMGNRAERIAGMELPASLAKDASERTNRPAQRLVREWREAEAGSSKKAVADYLQGLKRTVKMSEGWLAEYRSIQQAARRSATEQAAAFPQGPCHIPAGNWQVGSTREILEVKSDYFVTARKTKGSRNVPAGEVSFYLHPQTCDAGLMTAEEDFENAEWVRSRVSVRWIEPGEQFSIEWPARAAVTYTKVE